MSYAGTYGPDETCPHDCYWRNCKYCANLGPRPTEVQKEMARYHQAERKKDYLQHPVDAQNIEIRDRAIVVYDAHCPNPRCEWKRIGAPSRAVLAQEILDHMERANETARQWKDVDPEEAYVEP